MEENNDGNVTSDTTDDTNTEAPAKEEGADEGTTPAPESNA